ncbi:MAG: glyoxalase [Gemmatimonadetes bacterium]|nr:MAG: glyoxalase [Gemmatimonadota bacterium]
MTSAPVLRIARPSRSLHAAAGFYTRALGLEVLERFTDYAGLDGVIIGRAGWPYHLELTHQSEHTILPRPTAEDLLVFYFPDRATWESAIRQIRDTGARPVPSSNPYWDQHGLTFEDPDGYRVVIANLGWP